MSLPTRTGRSLSRASLMVAAALLGVSVSPQAKAANLFWDQNNSTGGAGGTGAWDTSSAFWKNAGTDTTIVGTAATSASAFTSADTAYFTGVAGTVTLGAPITIGGLVFSDITDNTTAGNYVIAGAGANILTLGAPTTSASPTIKVTTGNIATISARVSGANGFTKTGDGSLFLTNSSNNFTGDIYVRAGSLIVSNNSQLGAGTTPIMVQGFFSNGATPFSGGALVLNGATTGFELSRQVNIIGRGPGLVSGGAALISIGYNTLSAGLSLGSLNTESRAWSSFGTTTISGPLTLNSSVGTTGSSGAVMALQGNGNWIISGVVGGSDQSSANAGGSADRFTKTGQLTHTTLWLQNANNTYLGPLTVSSGTVRVGTNSALGLNTLANSVDLVNAALEVRTDSPTSFTTRNILFRSNAAATVFVDHAVSGWVPEEVSGRIRRLLSGAY